MLRGFLVALVLSALRAPASAPKLALAIRDHQFVPAELHLPANKKIELIVTNEDSTSEEFESYALNIEKRIKPKATVTIFLGPLKPGRYPFVGEYHEESARGVLIAE